MSINRISTPSFGILRKVINKNAGFYKLKIKKGELKKSNIVIYEEFFKNKSDLKLYWITDKDNKFLQYRLQHIDNGKIIKEINRKCE